MLSSAEIEFFVDKKTILIEPFKVDSLRGASYLLSMSDRVFVQAKDCVIDTRSTDTTDLFQVVKIEDSFIVEPGRLYLMETLERVQLPANFSADLSLLSSYARIGLLVNFGASHVSCGYGSKEPAPLTFEIINLSRSNIILYPFVKFCHLRFYKHDLDSKKPYSGIYDKSNGGNFVFSRFDLKPAK